MILQMMNIVMQMLIMNHDHGEDDNHHGDSENWNGHNENNHGENETDHDDHGNIEEINFVHETFNCFRRAPPLHEYWGTGGSAGGQRGRRRKHIPGGGIVVLLKF